MPARTCFFGPTPLLSIVAAGPAEGKRSMAISAHHTGRNSQPFIVRLGLKNILNGYILGLRILPGTGCRFKSRFPHCQIPYVLAAVANAAAFTQVLSPGE